MNKDLTFVSIVVTTITAVIFITSFAPSVSSAQTSCFTFTRDLRLGMDLSTYEAAALASDLSREGLWTSGTVITTYDTAVFNAVKAFQEKYPADILVPNGLVSGTGFFGPSSRMKINSLYGCAGIYTTSQAGGPNPSVQCPSGMICTLRAPVTSSTTPVCPANMICSPRSSSSTYVPGTFSNSLFAQNNSNSYNTQGNPNITGSSSHSSSGSSTPNGTAGTALTATSSHATSTQNGNLAPNLNNSAYPDYVPGSYTQSLLDSASTTNGGGAGSSTSTGQYYFGGMYGTGNGSGGLINADTYTNPLAGNKKACPTGYTAYPILGTQYLDYALYMCLGKSDSVEPVAQFGGMFGTPYKSFTNPLADNKRACPTGYTAKRVYGSSPTNGAAALTIPGLPSMESIPGMSIVQSLPPVRMMNSIFGGGEERKFPGDYLLSFCYAPVSKEHVVASFEGAYSYSHGNIVSGKKQSCPKNSVTKQALGAIMVDYALKYCYVSLASSTPAI